MTDLEMSKEIQGLFQQAADHGDKTLKKYLSEHVEYFHIASGFLVSKYKYKWYHLKHFICL